MEPAARVVIGPETSDFEAGENGWSPIIDEFSQMEKSDTIIVDGDSEPWSRDPLGSRDRHS